MNTEDFSISIERYAPKAGCRSLVCVDESVFPLSFGNYFWIEDGPYIVNFWAENLKEWAKRNPEVPDVEVTVMRHGDRSLGVITDERLKDWSNNRLCMTGHGWGSMKILRAVGELTGIPISNQFCGCESDEQSPHISQSWSEKTGKVNHCHNCNRSWKP